MSSPISITLVGATGLTGSAAFSALLNSPVAVAITTLTRKALATPVDGISTGNTHSNRHIPDLFEGPSAGEPLITPGGVYISCLGTTRGQAGGLAQQKKLDLDLNRDLAQRAKKDGADIAILVSSGGASAGSYNPYLKMKAELEEALKAMDFEHTIILQPGLLIGARDDTRIPEWTAQKLFTGLRAIGMPFMNRMMADGTAVGDCIAYLAVHPPTEKFVVLGNSEIVELGKKFRASLPK